MKEIFLFMFFTFAFVDIHSQPNCEAFRYYYNDTLKYQACKNAERIEGLYQFSKEYQEILDESIKIDSTFAYAYRKKSTAYLKSGDFITWKKLMNKAVKYNPQGNLEYRGLMRFKCFRDYRGALSDFQKLDNMGIQTDHLSIAKALCYNAIDEKERAIQILEKQIKMQNDLGLIGYVHLGVFCFEKGDYKKSLQFLFKQNEVNEIAESHFYIALCYKALQMRAEFVSHLKDAKRLYLLERRMSDVYIDPIHKIYLEDIESEDMAGR